MDVAGGSEGRCTVLHSAVTCRRQAPLQRACQHPTAVDMTQCELHTSLKRETNGTAFFLGCVLRVSLCECGRERASDECAVQERRPLRLS